MPEQPVALPLREPARGALWGADVLQVSGIEMLRTFLDRGLPDPPVARLTGLRLSEVGLGIATAAMPASAWWQSGAGVFLAGTIAFVADLPLSCAVLTSAPAGALVASSQLSLNFLRPATLRSQTAIGRARLIHSTRSLGLAEALIEDGRGRLLAHATSRCVVFRGDAGAFGSPTTTAPTASYDLPDPYLRSVEGDVLGQDFWDATEGIDAVRRVAKGTLRPPVSLLFDWRGIDAREGEFTMGMPASPWLCNAFGTLYGGVIALFADAAMTLAVGTTVPAATAYSPLDMTVHFLRPILPGGELLARARVAHRGRTIAVVSCEVVDTKGRLMAQASGSTLILPGRAWERPVNVAEEIPVASPGDAPEGR
jgi:uncharacterized protein (TIGR00369 family)